MELSTSGSGARALRYARYKLRSKGTMVAAAHLHVKDKALQGEAKDGRDGVKPDLARGNHFALAEGAVVPVVTLQVLRAQQPCLHAH